MAMMLAQRALSSHPGAWCRYQATGVGSGCVSKWKVSAVRFAQVGSPLEKLDGARRDHQPEQEPQEQPDRAPHRRRRVAQPVQPTGGRHEQGEETRFEEQRVPLVAEEVLADGHQRQIRDPGERGRDQRRHAGRQQDAGDNAHDADRGQERIARRDPEERGNDVESRQAEAVGAGPLARCLHEVARRQDAIAAEQSIQLHHHRRERAHVDHAEQAAENPCGPCVGGHIEQQARRRVILDRGARAAVTMRT